MPTIPLTISLTISLTIILISIVLTKYKYGTTHEDDAIVTDSTNENGDCENDDCDEMGWELDELVDDAMEFDEARGGLSDANTIILIIQK